jgi:hypothetical protein
MFIIKGNILIAVGFWSFATLVYVIKARSPQYLYFGYPDADEKLAYVIFFIVENYTKGVVMPWGILIHAWVTCTVAMETTTLTLIRKCKDPLEKRIQYFKCVYMLNTFHNLCYLPTLVPFRLALFGAFGLQGAVVMVRFRKRLDFAELGLVTQFGAAMFLCGILFLYISGGVFKNSKKLAGALRVQARGKYLQKSAKALCPFGVSCGPTKAFTYKSMLEFFVLVVSGITTVLHSVPHPVDD